MDYTGVALDRADGSSPYHQFAEALASAVARGDLPLGERLLSERWLATHLPCDCVRFGDQGFRRGIQRGTFRL